MTRGRCFRVLTLAACKDRRCKNSAYNVWLSRRWVRQTCCQAIARLSSRQLSELSHSPCDSPVIQPFPSGWRSAWFNGCVTNGQFELTDACLIRREGCSTSISCPWYEIGDCGRREQSEIRLPIGLSSANVNVIDQPQRGLRDFKKTHAWEALTLNDPIVLGQEQR
jgi:hypothetical protein